MRNKLGRFTKDKREPLSEAIKKKISIANIGKKRTLEQRKNISKGHEGIKRSEETKRKISLSNKGFHPITEIKKGQTGEKSPAWKGKDK